jgi:hypothetical protein
MNSNTNEQELFQMVSGFYNGFKGTFVEIGSGHPIENSNTYFLERSGWSGMLVEPITEYNSLYKINRRSSIVENFACVEKGYDQKKIESYITEPLSESNVTGIYGKESANTTKWPVSTISKLLKKHSIKLVDFLMIDVNGYEHEVLTGIDFGDANFGLIGIQWHDYNWNNKSNDFTYLGDYGYSYLTMAGTIEIWANNVFPLISRERYKTNL